MRRYSQDLLAGVLIVAVNLIVFGVSQRQAGLLRRRRRLPDHHLSRYGRSAADLVDRFLRNRAQLAYPLAVRCLRYRRRKWIGESSCYALRAGDRRRCCRSIAVCRFSAVAHRTGRSFYRRDRIFVLSGPRRDSLLAVGVADEHHEHAFSCLRWFVCPRFYCELFSEKSRNPAKLSALLASCICSSFCARCSPTIRSCPLRW